MLLRKKIFSLFASLKTLVHFLVFILNLESKLCIDFFVCDLFSYFLKGNQIDLAIKNIRLAQHQIDK